MIYACYRRIVTFTAQSRESPYEKTCFTFQQCSFTLSLEDEDKKFEVRATLGHPLRNYWTATILQCYISSCVDPRDGRVDWPGVRVLGNHNQALVFTASYFLDANSWILTSGVSYDRDGESRTTPKNGAAAGNGEDGESRKTPRNGFAAGNGECGVVPEGEDYVGCCFGFSSGPKGVAAGNGGGNGEGVASGNGEGVAIGNGEGNDEGVIVGNGEGVVDPKEEEDCLWCYCWKW
ncbi:hypothetical protein KIW84_058426 [Lathyrus oleraceus]|uniref:Pectinesterase catalytic domain-containing protein n=1 Tax=Pisum sativum TaxID=3888 RepID=A0A9D4X409_PEA|nr:hypothetical protein KIW84_058426 [Pisum sativum]